METIPSILINRIGALGDVILITPIVRKIYFDHGGKCQITVRTHWTNVFQNNPYVHTLINEKEPLDISKFDKIINLDLVYEKNPRMHIVDAYGTFAFGHNLFDRRSELHPSKKDEELAFRFKDQIGGSYITLHMRNTHQENRNIPKYFWNNLIIEILNFTSLPIVQIGTKSDFAFGGNDKLLDMREKFNLQELREVIDKSDLYIGVDSAPLHIAATTRTEIIAFFTTARGEYRKPLRAIENFTEIKPEIDCYGCQVNLPLGSTMAICQRKDNDCVNQFDFEKTLNLIKSKITSLRS